MAKSDYHLERKPGVKSTDGLQFHELAENTRRAFTKEMLELETTPEIEWGF